MPRTTMTSSNSMRVYPSSCRRLVIFVVRPSGVRRIPVVPANVKGMQSILVTAPPFGKRNGENVKIPLSTSRSVGYDGHSGVGGSVTADRTTSQVLRWTTEDL